MTDDVTPEALADDVADLARELEQLRALYDETKARLDNVHLDLAELVQAVEAPPVKPADNVYEDWHTWVVMWLEPRVSRGQHHRWCLKLQEHPEAEMRLESVWLAWEAMWPKSAERASWLRDCLDPQLLSLMTPDGALRLCSAAEHQHTTPPDLKRLKTGPGMMLQ
ncbi:DUF4913 domain-containing protein [Kineosporia sp. A_224]|uniref:DUF4913 domain-containing protein n=1 Tax=Kineosporia sp. A_224 TaxID=1962180 RepID=UPI000B4B872C|nr:DUF4913 domain-containing protein [Kineosporia sp. A_224]